MEVRGESEIRVKIWDLRVEGQGINKINTEGSRDVKNIESRWHDEKCPDMEKDRTL